MILICYRKIISVRLSLASLGESARCGKTLHDVDTHNLSRDRLRFLLFASLLVGEGCHVRRRRVINRWSTLTRRVHRGRFEDPRVSRVNGCFLTRHEERRLEEPCFFEYERRVKNQSARRSGHFRAAVGRG